MLYVEYSELSPNMQALQRGSATSALNLPERDIPLWIGSENSKRD